MVTMDSTHPLCVLISDCRTRLHQCHVSKIQFVYCEANRSVDLLTRNALCFLLVSLSCNILIESLSFMFTELRDDTVGVKYSITFYV